MENKIYQLYAGGPMAEMSGSHSIRSRKVFTTRKAAEDYQEDFHKSCCKPINERDLMYLSRIDNHGISELELCEEY